MILLSEATLYYFFSTLAQVLAALVALVAVLVHFRVNALRDFLVGDGSAILRRAEQNIDAYQINAKHKNRLRDAVDRNDIGGIKRIVKRLAEREKEKGITKEDNPTGLQYVCDNFIETEEQIEDMTWTSKHAFIWALVTSLYSVLAILLIDLISKSVQGQIITISLNLILLFICGYFIFKGMLLAFKNFTTRFTDIE